MILPTSADRRIVWLQRWLALAALALIGATWRLWTASTDFPRIPWFSWLCGVPNWCDLVALAGLVAGLVLVLVLAPWRDRFATPKVRIAISAILAISGGTLLLLDQHRLQPWAYQFAWIIFVLATAPAGRAFMLIRLLTIGIYFWSAISKFDATFLATTGPDLLRGLWHTLALDPHLLDGNAAARLAWGLPLGELAVACLLAIRWTRRFGLLASIVMHGLLLVVLGPWGLDHQPGVLLWNLYLIGQNLLLFGPRSEPAAGGDRHWPAFFISRNALASGSSRNCRKPWASAHRLMRRGARLMNNRGRGLIEIAVALALLLPILEPFGWFDHWPAWAVYAPGAERVTLLVDSAAAERLPESIQAHLGPPQWPHGRQVVRTDLWSLRAVSAPIYPQGRFRAAVALAIIEKYQLDVAATLIVASRADRLTGQRTVRTFHGAEAITRHAASYWVNTCASGGLRP